MVEIIDTSLMQPDQYKGLARHSIYNGLDTCVTREVFDTIQLQHTPDTQLIYDFERACQAPALEMMLRGIKVDGYERFKLLHNHEKDLLRLDDILFKYLKAMDWFPISPKFARSHVQLKKFFYEFLSLPKQYKYDKGQKKVTCNRDALEELQAYRYARPIIKVILKSRDLSSLINVLRSGVDRDGRMRFGFNVAGTETGRWSSNENAFGSGTTGHNITDTLRRIFIADEGYKMAYADLEQAESRVVGYISEDEAYIGACTSGDLHTQVAKIIWPELPWTGVLAEDKKLAKVPFYRHWHRRDLSKRGGHLTNYYGKAVSNAKKLQLTIDTMKSFQSKYLKEFNGISDWHVDTATQLQTTGVLTTQLCRRRFFLGRRYDDATLREAIAYEPQSVVGELLNLGMYRIWKHSKICELLSQLHDAILVQFKEEDEEEAIKELQDRLTIPVKIKGRTMIIPVEVKVGWNWASYDDENPEENPDGLRVCPNGDDRTRQISPSTPLMKRIIS